MAGRLCGPLLFSILALSGCHGGGSGASGMLGKDGTASFTVAVPIAAGSQPQSMQSVTIALTQVNGAPPAVAVKPVEANLAIGSPGCTVATGTLTCVETIQVPSGSDAFTVATFAQPNGTGTVVSTSQALATITPGGKSTCTQLHASAPAGSGVREPFPLPTRTLTTKP